MDTPPSVIGPHFVRVWPDYRSERGRLEELMHKPIERQYLKYLDATPFAFTPGVEAVSV
jgi:hypothetical protein